MFPGAGAVVYTNEAGEPLGWDYPSYDEPDYDPYEEDYDPYEEDYEDTEFDNSDPYDNEYDVP